MNTFYTRIISIGLLLTFGSALLEVNAQNVGISNSAITPDASSILELKSTESGFLMPRMTEAERDSISSPATGLIIYQTNISPGYYFFDGGTWGPIEGIDNLGNHQYTQNMETDGNWLSGDSDDEGIFITSDGKVGIGTDSPAGRLQVSSPTSADPFVYRGIKNSNGAGELVGFGLGSQAGASIVKSGIVHQRESSNGVGKVHILVDDATDGNDVGLSESRMTIDRNGKVGIGSTSPSERLDVVGKTKTEELQITTGATDGYILQGDASGNVSWLDPSGLGGSADNLGNHLAAQNIELDGNWISGDGANEGIYVTDNGNVGVGTSSPSGSFQVESSSSSNPFLV